MNSSCDLVGGKITDIKFIDDGSFDVVEPCFDGMIRVPEYTHIQYLSPQIPEALRRGWFDRFPNPTSVSIGIEDTRMLNGDLKRLVDEGLMTNEYLQRFKDKFFPALNLSPEQIVFNRVRAKYHTRWRIKEE